MPIHTPVFDATGLITLRSAQVIENMVADLKTKPAWGSQTQAESDDALAQLLTPTGDAIGQCYELLQAIYDAWDPDAAIGSYQDNLYWILGLIREPATRSYTSIDVTGGQAFGSIPAGLQCRIPDGPFFQTTDQGGDLDGSGDGFVYVEALDTGPIQAPATTISEKVDTDPSWDTATISNPFDATLGRNVESHSDYRNRRQGSLSRVGSATDQAIRAALEALTAVTAAAVISNRTLEEVDGVPGKSFECVIWPWPTSDPDGVAERIWEHMPAGIESFGDVLALVEDTQGDLQTVGYSGATELDIYWDVVVTTKSGYPGDGDDQVADAVLAYGNSLHVGDDVEPIGAIDRIRIGDGDADGVPGVGHLVVTLKAGSAPGPTDTVPIPVSQREIGDHDLARIVVTS